MTDKSDEVAFRSPVVFGNWGKIYSAALYDERPRTWRERLFSWPWRPWVKDRPVIIVDLENE